MTQEPNDTGKKNLRAKWRPRHFAISTGCRGHPCPRKRETQGWVLHSIKFLTRDRRNFLPFLDRRRRHYDHHLAAAEALLDLDAFLKLAPHDDRYQMRRVAAHDPHRIRAAFRDDRLLRHQHHWRCRSLGRDRLESDLRAHFRLDNFEVRLQHSDLDFHRAFLPVGFGINLHDSRRERIVGIRVEDHRRGRSHFDLRDVAFVDIDFAAQVAQVRQLRDIGGAAAARALAEGGNSVAEFAILLQHHAVDWRSDHSLSHVEFCEIDRADRLVVFRLCHRKLILRVIERVLRLHSLSIQLAQTLCPRPLQHNICLRQIAIRVRLPELRLVVAIVDTHQYVANLDPLPFLDRLRDYLPENLGANHDVLVPCDYIPAAGQHGARLSRLLDADDRSLHFGRASKGLLINDVSCSADNRENHERDRCRYDPARLLRIRRARNPERLELADIRSLGCFGGQGHTLLSASTTGIFIACRAGSQPPTIPITAAKIIASTTIANVTRKLNASVENVTKFPNVVDSPLIGIARRIPTAPAATASTSDSSRNDVITAIGAKPSARSVPISVVRDETAAYIVFIAPNIAPTAIITATIIPSTRIWLATTA